MLERKSEKVRGRPDAAAADRGYVTINKENVIGINANCYRLLGKPPAVYLYYSRPDNVIASEPCHSPRTPAAFPAKQKTSVDWRINAEPFCKHYGIRIDATKRFINPEKSRDGKMLLLKLTETVTTKNLRVKKK